MRHPRQRRSRNIAANHRQAMLVGMGKQLKRQGVKVGRKVITTDKIPNFPNYKGIMRGMGMAVRRVDPRKLH